MNYFREGVIMSMSVFLNGCLPITQVHALANIYNGRDFFLKPHGSADISVGVSSSLFFGQKCFVLSLRKVMNLRQVFRTSEVPRVSRRFFANRPSGQHLRTFIAAEIFSFKPHSAGVFVGVH